MVCFPNAKINIGLSITEKRSDGFHNIESCFYPIQWCDILEIIPADQTVFTSSGIPIPGDHDDNLCLKAYELLQKDFKLPPVAIHLHKIIPIGAGLGGGSSDASFTLKTLNTLFELNLSDDQLISYAKRLGSDCPFFIKNEPVIAINKGDEFQHCNLDLKGKYILLVYPNKHISTAEAYSGITPQKTSIDYKNLSFNELKKAEVVNDFETQLIGKYVQLQEIRDDLKKAKADYISLSGSGSTMFGIFSEPPNVNFDNYLIKSLTLN